jgi:hypothetical protein
VKSRDRRSRSAMRVERVREHVHLARHGRLGDQAAAFVRDLVEALRDAGQALPETLELVQAGAIDQQAVDRVQEPVAGAAVDRPVVGEVLAGRHDLLGHDEERQRVGDAPRAAGRLLQRREVRGRIVQAVRVVEPEAGDEPVAHELEHQPMRLLEDLRVLHAHRAELVDVEEAAVVDLVEGRAPVRQPVRLLLEQRVQGVEARRLPGHAVEACDRLVERGRDPGRAVDEMREALAGDRRLAPALLAPRHPALGRGRQVRERSEHAQQLAHVRIVGPRVGAERLGGVLQRQGNAPRVDWQRVLEVPEHERPALPRDPQLAALQHGAVLIAQDGQQHLVVQGTGDGLPVDVEPLGRERARAVFEHVTPARVGRRIDGHVVRHEVEHQVQASRRRVAGQRLELLARAELGVEARVVHDVVAVRAARAGRQHRRQVAAARSERRQVRQQGARAGERQVRAELQAVRAGRNPRPGWVGRSAHRPTPSRANTTAPGRANSTASPPVTSIRDGRASAA